MIPRLDRIIIHPIKSLDGISVQSTQVMPGGSLAHDREYAIFDADGRVVNAKRSPQIQLLRSKFDLGTGRVTIAAPEVSPATFDLGDNQLEDWLTGYFGFAVHLEQNCHTGFPDDLESPGPTIISTATLESVRSWFAGSTVNEMRDRFRSNLEFSETPAFWEDQLYGTNFQIGDVEFAGVNPCLRCVVPTRHPVTANVTPNFAREFADRRQQDRPPWAEVSRFKSYYRLAANTRIRASGIGKVLRVGDLYNHI
jgi:uncharacterized protein